MSDAPSLGAGKVVSRGGDRLLAAAIFLGLFLFYAGFDQARDWNTSSRMLLTCAIVQNGAIEITPFVTRESKILEHPQTRDLAATADGRFFCDKAPGHSFVGVPGYALMLSLGAVPAMPAGMPAVERWPADRWIASLSSGLLAAATASLVFLFARALGCSSFAGLAAALAFGLGTIALPYATLNYGHASAGFFSLASLYAFWMWPRSIAAGVAAGLLAGAAVLVDYPQVVFPLALASLSAVQMLLARTERETANWIAFLLGGMPAAILLGWYHYRVTGSPFQFPYTLEFHDELFGYHKEGYGVPIGWPSAEVAGELLAGRRRGLLWFCPTLLAAPLGLWVLFRRGEGFLAAAATATFLGLFWINAGFPAWDGGWSTGPRFLLPALPLFFPGIAAWIDARPARCWWSVLHAALVTIWGAATVVGAIVMTVYTAAGARVPPQIDHPHVDFALRSLEGRPGENLGTWLGRAIGVGGASGSLMLLLAVETAIAVLLYLIARRISARS